VLFGETIRVALGALRANKLRSLLTMLGIVIGVSAVIAVVALGRGAQQAVNDRIASLGTTLLTVSPGQARTGGVMTFDVRTRLLMEDAEALVARRGPPQRLPSDEPAPYSRCGPVRAAGVCAGVRRR